MRKKPTTDSLAHLGGFCAEAPVVINDSGECESCDESAVEPSEEVPDGEKPNE